MTDASSLAEWLQGAAPGVEGPVAALALAATAAIMSSRARSFSEAAAATALVLFNPFFAIALAADDPRFALTASAALLAFDGAFAFASRKDDRGVVEFALLIAAGVALVGVEPALHAPLGLWCLLLSPWGLSLRKALGVWMTLALPSAMVVFAGLYLKWLSQAPISLDVPEVSLSAPSADFFALAAAPSPLLALIAPRLAGGARRAALFSLAVLISACALAPAGAFMSLGAVAAAAETAWALRLGRSAAASLSAALLISAGLVWTAFGQPASFEALGNALDAASRTARALH